MKRCLVIKTYGDQEMASAIAPVLANEEDHKKEEYKRLNNEYKLQKPKLEEYYRMKIEEAHAKYDIRKEPFYKRWFDMAMAMLFVFFHSCVREVESED